MAKKRPAKEFGIYQVMLRPEVDSSEFEKFMGAEVLENTITFRDGHSSQDELYMRRGGGEENSYIWIISRTPSLGGGFNNNSDAAAAFKALKGKVETFGDVLPL
jgi:hypothetical protein